MSEIDDEALIAALWRVVAAHGWGGLTMGRLAAEAGMPLADLRGRFPSRLDTLVLHGRLMDRAVLAGTIPGQGGAARPHDRPAGAQRCSEIARGRALDADDAHLRAHRLDRERQTGDQAAAADRAHDGIGIAHLVEDLETHGALAGDDVGGVEAVDIGVPAFGREGIGAGAGLDEILAVHHHIGAEALAGRDLDERSVIGHHDRDRDAQELAMVGEPEGMVAGAGGDDPAAARGGGQLEKRVAGPALLERAGALEVIQFAEDMGAHGLGERDGLGTRGDDDSTGDAAARGADVGKGDRHARSLAAGARLETGMWARPIA